MHHGVEIGFALDRRWHLMKAEEERSKRPDLLLLARVLSEAAVPYAIIGGVALQFHQDGPRTTLDIGLAVADAGDIPRAGLEIEGFVATGVFVHSINWRGPGGTPVQFTTDPALAEAIARAEAFELDGIPLKVLRTIDLLHEKLRAARDAGRRPSKRVQDLADALSLLEGDPALVASLTLEERATLDRITQRD